MWMRGQRQDTSTRWYAERPGPNSIRQVQQVECLILTDNRMDTRHTKITPFDGATGGALLRRGHVISSTSIKP